MGLVAFAKSLLNIIVYTIYELIKICYLIFILHIKIKNRRCCYEKIL
nr:MAG TPA: hypothetical protein [Caudoviricetes sp.]